MTTEHIQIVQRMRAYIEPNGSLGTDHSGTLGDFWDVPFIEGTADLTLERPTLDPAYARQERDDHNVEVMGIKRAKLKFSINLGPPTARAGSTVEIDEPPVGKLLGLVMGGTNLGTGDVATSGSTSGVVQVTTAAQWQAGGCIGWADTSGVMHMREIEEMSGAAAILKLALPSAPLTADPLYNCATYYLDNHDSDDVTTLQVIVEGLGHSVDGYNDCWVLMGGQIEEVITPELSSGEIPKITFSFTFADWEQGDDAALTPAALGVATYTDVNEQLIVDSSFRVQTVGTSALTGTLYHPIEYGFEPQFKYIEHTSPAGVNNIAAFVMDGTHPKVTGSYKLPYQDQTWFDARNNSTAKAVTLQIGSSETYGAILISAPTVQVTEFQRTDANGIMGQEVKWRGRCDDDTTESTTTYMGRSPLRIHIC